MALYRTGSRLLMRNGSLSSTGACCCDKCSGDCSPSSPCQPSCRCYQGTCVTPCSGQCSSNANCAPGCECISGQCQDQVFPCSANCIGRTVTVNWVAGNRSGTIVYSLTGGSRGYGGENRFNNPFVLVFSSIFCPSTGNDFRWNLSVNICDTRPLEEREGFSASARLRPDENGCPPLGAVQWDTYITNGNASVQATIS